MQYGNIFSTIGKMTVFLGLIQFLPLLVSFYYGESLFPFAISIIISLFIAAVLLHYFKPTKDDWTVRESYAIVSLGWLLASVLGSIPFLIYGISPVNALFESMSGITTTGATALDLSIPYGKGFHFWRTLLHWTGGLGIVALFLAVLPKISRKAVFLFNAEVKSGVDDDKLSPRISITSKILLGFYVSLTVIVFLVLFLLGLSPYDALVHAFSIIGSGGFSNYAESAAHFKNSYVNFAITIFMLVAGTNFGLMYRTIFQRKVTKIFKDEEFISYIIVFLFISSLLIFVLWKDMNMDFFESLENSFFHVASMMSTTGFMITDYNQWSDSSKMLLTIAAIVGGCSGSTAGGPLITRWLILLKHCRRDIFKKIHPSAVKTIQYNGKTISDSVVQSTLSFMILWAFLISFSTFLLSLLGIDIITSLTSSIATINNVGPGLNLVGPASSYKDLPSLAKMILIMNMWIGRLNIYTVLSVFTFEFWKK